MGDNREVRTALVTGGTRGIGAAIVDRLAREGIRVIVTGRSLPGHRVPGCVYHAVNFEDRQATAEFVGRVSGFAVDILVNNAGINKISEFEHIDRGDFDRLYEVNVRAPLLLCQAVLPHMRKKGWGRIVNISSIFGKISKEYRASYSASKFGLDGMTAALAAEVASKGIIVNCVAPGFIETDLTRNILGEAGISDLVKRIPMKRLGQPSEIAAFVSWLAGPENTYVSGQNIAIDGGFTRV